MMKTYRSIRIIMLLVTAVPLLAQAKQKNKDEPYLQGNGYTFIPQTMFPLGMPAQQLTSVFELYIGKDSLSSYLPYAGRAFQVAYGSRSSVTDFTSADFTYSETHNSKGVYKIRIDLNDNREVRTISITVYTGKGKRQTEDNADVQITFNQHQGITYRGRILKKETP